MSIESRLSDIIDEKDKQLQELKEKLEQMELKTDLQNMAYQLHEHFEESDLQKTLPYPRLEMRFRRIENHRGRKDWYNVEWHYGIVHKHYVDTRNNMMLFIPLGKTTSSGGGAEFEDHFHSGRLETPHRDIVHIFSESIVFGMPAYIICEEKNIVQKIELDIDITDALGKMVRRAGV